jgi:hypothetical protein
MKIQQLQHQFHMKDVLLVHNSSSGHNCGNYGMLLGLVVMRTRVEMEVIIGIFTIYVIAYRAVRSPW